MSAMDWAMAAFLVTAWISWGYIGYQHIKISKQLKKYEQVRKTLYEKLADPAQIEADFEKSARAREMRDAQRTTLPRPDAGPPAKVWRPKMRGAKPGNWRVNRP